MTVTGAAPDTRTPPEAGGIDPAARNWVVAATLAALFLGALDALVMSAAMPTIITDLGGMELYSWVYSAYFLSRAVCLPVFGKLADLLAVKRLFIISITIFLLASVFAGVSPGMGYLIAARALQGVGAAGIFALVYIVLADIAPPGKRAKLLSLASTVWGIASVLGPSLGGFMVTYLSWRWIFFINVPISLFSMVLVAAHLIEVREKKDRVYLDIPGVVTLSVAVLGLLTLVMVGGKGAGWLSAPSLLLMTVTVVFAVGFYVAEKRAREPILSLAFFSLPGFRTGNASVFLSSFAIFSLFAYAPLFIQGALGKTPVQVGLAMISLSLGWSLGSFILGQTMHRMGERTAAVIGALSLTVGAGATLTFTPGTSMQVCFWVFFLAGLGMGFVTLATLLVVQASLDGSNLGVATSSHQFARTLGGAIGVGVCGGVVTARFAGVVVNLRQGGGWRTCRRVSPPISPTTWSACSSRISRPGCPWSGGRPFIRPWVTGCRRCSGRCWSPRPPAWSAALRCRRPTGREKGPDGCEKTFRRLFGKALDPVAGHPFSKANVGKCPGR